VPADQHLIDDLRRSLQEAADPTKAPAMQAYMKSAMPFYGVPSPVAKRVFTDVLATHPLPDRETWESTVRALWHDAAHREERYGALALAGHSGYRAFQDPDILGLYREFVVTGSWWDYVDEIASRKVGPILRAHHDVVRPTILSWATDEDMWLRRTAIISQLGAKGDTDLHLLALCIERNLEPEVGHREFFIRKAIGWALRQYAWHDPDWVNAFVEQHADRLSPLSRREALKNIGVR
jgi:3-methyladenine DNA glycosylase AlkD